MLVRTTSIELMQTEWNSNKLAWNRQIQTGIGLVQTGTYKTDKMLTGISWNRTGTNWQANWYKNQHY